MSTRIQRFWSLLHTPRGMAYSSQTLYVDQTLSLSVVSAIFQVNLG